MIAGNAAAPQRVAIVGAGIIGLAHAWFAARAGHRVTVFDRNRRTMEATVRNFGMIWPIGQPLGERYSLAKRSRDLWLELADAAKFWVNSCGSIHLAHQADELAVLEEFASLALQRDVECRMLSPSEVQNRTPAANPDGLRGGLFSPIELCVNPRRVTQHFAHYLAEKYDVQFQWSTPVVGVFAGELKSAGNAAMSFDKIIIASGSEMKLLFPNALAAAGLKRCKLQMLKTAPQPSGWRIGTHLASGLTLRHYQSFAACPSLAALQARVAAESPLLDRYGIHVMASQNDDGEVILGDSHEYDDAIEPFQKSLIDDLMLAELHKIIRLADWTIAQRWEGIYVKHSQQPFIYAEPEPGVHLFTGVGGAGMTMSLGLAEQFWSKLEHSHGK